MERRDQTTRGEDAAGQMTSSKSASRKAPPEPSEDQIRARAYEMYQRRGAGHGADVDDWLEAERVLTDESHRDRDEDLTEEV